MIHVCLPVLDSFQGVLDNFLVELRLTTQMRISHRVILLVRQRSVSRNNTILLKELVSSNEFLSDTVTVRNNIITCETFEKFIEFLGDFATMEEVGERPGKRI